MLFTQRDPFMPTDPLWLIVNRVVPEEDAVKRLPDDPELLMLMDEEAWMLFI